MSPESTQASADHSPTGGLHVTQLFLSVDDSAAGFSSIADALEAAAWPTDRSDADARPTVEQVALTEPAARRRLSDILATVRSACLVVVYPNPGIRLARQLPTPDSTLLLDNWRAETSEVLDFYRQHRRQVLLIDGHAALSCPLNFAEETKSRLGAVLDTDRLSGDESAAATAGIARLIVEHAIRLDPEAYRLLVELLASSLPVSSIAEGAFGDPLQEWRDVMGASPERIEELEEENALLLEQLHKVQEELEPYLLAGASPYALKAARSDLASLRAQLANKAKQIEMIYASKSWKVTAPLRRVLDLVGGK